MRKFEFTNRIISNGYETKKPDFNLPQRKTKYSAGYDFECIEALDLELFNAQLSDLINGREIIMPKFNFKPEDLTDLTRAIDFNYQVFY